MLAESHMLAVLDFFMIKKNYECMLTYFFFFCMLTYLIKITLKDLMVIAILRLHMSEKRSVAKIKYLFLF